MFQITTGGANPRFFLRPRVFETAERRTSPLSPPRVSRMAGRAGGGSGLAPEHCRGVFNSHDDLVVPGAAAEVAGETCADLFFRRIRIAL